MKMLADMVATTLHASFVNLHLLAQQNPPVQEPMIVDGIHPEGTSTMILLLCAACVSLVDYKPCGGGSA